MPRRKHENHNGFTLIEICIVVAILSVIALLAVSRVERVAGQAKLIAAESDLKNIREAFMDPDHGYIRDLRGIPGFSLAYLRVANLLMATNLYVAAEDDARGVRTSAFSIDDPAHAGSFGHGIAAYDEFVKWNPERERGWRGPYLRGGSAAFPARDAVRHDGDGTFAARGFYPDLLCLRLPIDFIGGKLGCSVYGFPGEPAVMDPWGNPYVLQIPPPQAFWDRYDTNTNLADEVRFQYARVVSAGPDGRLDTPCFTVNGTNDWRITTWSEEACRSSRQAGRVDGALNRGDDLVLFLRRSDVDEGRVR